MTNLEREQAALLNNVTFLPGSYDKRFARSMQAIAEQKPDLEITEKQSALLGKMVHRYRRQIPNHKTACPICSAMVTA